MSDRFAAASGRKVVSRTSAEQLGEVAHIVVDVKRMRVASLVVGKGRKELRALLVEGRLPGLGLGPVALRPAQFRPGPRHSAHNSLHSLNY